MICLYPTAVPAVGRGRLAHAHQPPAVDVIVCDLGVGALVGLLQRLVGVEQAKSQIALFAQFGPCQLRRSP